MWTTPLTQLSLLDVKIKGLIDLTPGCRQAVARIGRKIWLRLPVKHLEFRSNFSVSEAPPD